jgi:hypothetical protein
MMGLGLGMGLGWDGDWDGMGWDVIRMGLGFKFSKFYALV